MRLTEAQFAALAGKKAPGGKKKPAGMPDAFRSNVQGKRTIGKKTYRFRSLWEMNYARYLEFLRRKGEITDWEYEPTVFRFPKEAYDAGPFLYKPDFVVTEVDKTRRWHEVKGWLNPSSKKKIKRFHKHFPQEGEIILVGKEWFSKARNQNLHKIIPGWESLADSQASR